MSDNLISRDELLKAIDTWDKFGYSARYGLERLDKDDKGYVPYIHYDDVIKCIKGMPSVNPQEPKWIPVSERLPELDVDVLVTDIHGNRFVHTLKHDSEDEAFYWEDDAGFFVDFNDVIAWMSLPQPYKEESEDER